MTASASALNPLNQIDFYKSGHIFQYPEGTESVYSNFTARSDRLAPVLRSGLAPFDGKVAFVGLQGFMKEFLIGAFNRGFFDLPKEVAVRQYKRRMDNALGAGAVPVDHIAALHDLGYLPIRIKALPEGSRVNLKVPLFTVRETNKKFAWVVNYLETVLSNGVWKSITVATIAYEFRRLLEAYCEMTGADPGFIDWQGHNFADRGMSGWEDAARSGFAHLASFFGTDSVSSIDYAECFYGANSDEQMVGGSVPATEHSVMSMGGRLDELSTIRRLVTEVYPSGIVSVVSDTWDFWKVITVTALTLKDEIRGRKPNALGQAKVVFRPDSGNPVHILAGYEWDELKRGPYGPDVDENGLFTVKATGEKVTQNEVDGAVQCLWNIFGGTSTAKGFKVLNERVGLIYGDSITLERAEQIMSRLARKGFASTNCVFGIGSYTYQYLTRDCFGMAMKATWGTVNGEARELSKDPATDKGSIKKSAVGLLRVEREGDDYVLYDRQTPEQEEQGLLQDVFVDGKLVREQTLEDIRYRLRNEG